MNKLKLFLKNNLWVGYRKFISIPLVVIIMVVTFFAIVATFRKEDGSTIIPVPFLNPQPSVTPSKTPTASKSKTSTGKSENGSSESQNDSSSSSSNDSDSGDENNTPSGESQTAFVAFYADSQSDSDEEDGRHLTVVDKILASGANPVFHAGDLMENGTQDSINRFNNIAGGLLGSRSFYAALGNNDRNGGDTTTPSPLFLENFSFPNNERWYSVNSGDLHLVVLDSAFASGSAAQLSWLESDLQSEASQSRVTGVMFHHPTFAGTINSYLVNNGVDFVVSGHVHSYSNSSSNGINYFTLSGGGSMGYAFARIYSSYAKFYAYDTDGGLVDAVTFSAR